MNNTKMKYDSLTDKQKQVFEAAKTKLSDRPWFRGVCCDNFPSDKEIEENFDDAVRGVMFETAMWDDPNFCSFDSGNPPPIINTPKTPDRRLFDKYIRAIMNSNKNWHWKSRRSKKWDNAANKLYRRMVKEFGEYPLEFFKDCY